MSTKAGAVGLPDRRSLFTLWMAIVSGLAAAALIMSVVAIRVSDRREGSAAAIVDNGTEEAVAARAPLWDAGKLEAMKGRVLAASVEQSEPLWDAGKLEAMQGRVLAESPRSDGFAPLWDAGKLEAMKGRMLAASVEH